MILSLSYLSYSSSIRLVWLLNIGPKVNHLKDFGHLTFLDKISFMTLQLSYFIKYHKQVEYQTLDLNFFRY